MVVDVVEFPEQIAIIFLRRINRLVTESQKRCFLRGKNQIKKKKTYKDTTIHCPGLLRLALPERLPY